MFLSQQSSFKLSVPRYVANSSHTCVRSEREKEDYSERYGYVMWVVCRITHWKYTALNDSCKPVFVLRKHVFCVVAPCGWVIASGCFEETYHIYLQGYESMNLLNTLKMKAVHFFETPGRNYPTTQCSNLEDWFLNSHSVETSNHCFRIVKNIF
jgi:hypothetical protein